MLVYPGIASVRDRLCEHHTRAGGAAVLLPEVAVTHVRGIGATESRFVRAREELRRAVAWFDLVELPDHSRQAGVHPSLLHVIMVTRAREVE